MWESILVSIAMKCIQMLIDYAQKTYGQHEQVVQKDSADAQTKAASQAAMDSAKTKADQLAVAKDALKGL